MSKSKPKQDRPPMHTEPLAVRRTLADEYHRQASNPRLTTRDRAAFAKLADAWRATLDER
ncbi:MAG: hypothetical protein PHU85_14595 [Phycisphaerae bacterium]|nr:hypothetical protein [Phycisphaerae bacterium]